MEDQQKKLIIGIDTTNDWTSLAIGEKERVWKGDRNQSRDILLFLDEMMKENKYSWDDIGGVVVINGPGSYTGIRIGVTVANTIGMALRVPVKQVDGLIVQVSGIKYQVSSGNSEVINNEQLIINNENAKTEEQVFVSSAKIFSMIGAGGTRVYGKKYQVSSNKYQVEDAGEYFVGEIGEFLGDVKEGEVVVGEQVTSDQLLVTRGVRDVEVINNEQLIINNEDAGKKTGCFGNMIILDESVGWGRAGVGVSMFDELPELKNNLAVPLYLREAVRK